MTALRVRRTLAILIVLSILLPVVLAVLHVVPPSIVLVGLLLAYSLSRGYALLGRERVQEQLFGLEKRSSDASRTIYVPLIDEHGALLPREERERRLAEAQQNAGPRDVVVPVTKRMKSD